MKAKCPICKEAQGPLANNLIGHLLQAHKQEVEWYEINSATIKLKGWLPGTLEFVKGAKP